MAFTPLHSSDDIPLWTSDGEPILLWDERDVRERQVTVPADPRVVAIAYDRSVCIGVDVRTHDVAPDGRTVCITASRTVLVLPPTA